MSSDVLNLCFHSLLPRRPYTACWSGFIHPEPWFCNHPVFYGDKLTALTPRLHPLRRLLQDLFKLGLATWGAAKSFSVSQRRGESQLLWDNALYYSQVMTQSLVGSCGTQWSRIWWHMVSLLEIRFCKSLALHWVHPFRKLVVLDGCHLFGTASIDMDLSRLGVCCCLRLYWDMLILKLGKSWIGTCAHNFNSDVHTRSIHHKNHIGARSTRLGQRMTHTVWQTFGGLLGNWTKCNFWWNIFK